MFKGYCYFIAAAYFSLASLWGPAPAQAAADEEPPHSSAPVQGPRTTSEDGVPENGDLQDETYALSLHMAEFCLSSPTTLTREAAPWDDQADAAASGSGQHTVGAVGSSHQGPLRDILTPGQQLYGGLPFNLANWIDPGHKGPPRGFQLLNLDDLTHGTDGTGGKSGTTGVSRFISKGIIQVLHAPHQNDIQRGATQRGAKAAAALDQQTPQIVQKKQRKKESASAPAIERRVQGGAGGAVPCDKQ